MQDIEEDQSVLEERPLVAGQHSANKQIALICSHCFQFLGSLAMQLAWCKLATMCQGRFVPWLDPYICSTSLAPNSVKPSGTCIGAVLAHSAVLQMKMKAVLFQGASVPDLHAVIAGTPPCDLQMLKAAEKDLGPLAFSEQWQMPQPVRIQSMSNTT